MRWFACLFILIIVFSSCKALKPVTESSSNTPTRTVSTTPQFIENISTNNLSGTRKGGYINKPIQNSVEVNNIISANAKDIEHAQLLRFKYAILMDVPVEEVDNAKLFDFIEEWYGTRYHFGGTTKDGIDCSAFAGTLMSAVFGIGLPRMAKEQYTVCQRVNKKDLQEGDLVFFHTTRRGVSHVGIYLTNNKFVHASLNYGVVISDLNDPYYHRKYVGAGRARQSMSALSAN